MLPDVGLLVRSEAGAGEPHKLYLIWTGSAASSIPDDTPILLSILLNEKDGKTRPISLNRHLNDACKLLVTKQNGYVMVF